MDRSASQGGLPEQLNTGCDYLCDRPYWFEGIRAGSRYAMRNRAQLQHRGAPL